MLSIIGTVKVLKRSDVAHHEALGVVVRRGGIVICHDCPIEAVVTAGKCRVVAIRLKSMLETEHVTEFVYESSISRSVIHLSVVDVESASARPVISQSISSITGFALVASRLPRD